MFNGDCKEAFDFYKRCFGGQIDFLGRYGDSPMEVTETQKAVFKEVLRRSKWRLIMRFTIY